MSADTDPIHSNQIAPIVLLACWLVDRYGKFSIYLLSLDIARMVVGMMKIDQIFMPVLIMLDLLIVVREVSLGA
jgi:hypothetical protein